jgi:hypothetical protein
MMNDFHESGDIASGKKLLKWMFTNKDLYLDSLVHANRLIKSILKLANENEDIARGDIDGVLKLLAEIPQEMLTFLESKLEEGMAEGTNTDYDIRLRNSMYEFSTYKSYLVVLQQYSNWDSCYRLRPVRPNRPPPQDAAEPSEYISYEHNLKQYEKKTRDWQMKQRELAAIAEKEIRQYLKFLSIQVTGVELEEVKRICIPESVLLLHRVLHSTEQYAKWYV